MIELKVILSLPTLRGVYKKGSILHQVKYIIDVIVQTVETKPEKNYNLADKKNKGN